MTGTLATVVVAVADGGLALADCERVRPGLLAQPANTLSSLAFIVAGLALVAMARSARRAAPDLVAGPVRRRLLAVGLAVGMVGLGSVVYHAGLGAAGQLLHDLGLFLAPLVVLVLTVVPDRPRGALRAIMLATVIAAATMAVWPPTGVWVGAGTGVAAIGAVVLRWPAGSSGRVRSETSRLVAAVGLGVTAGVLYWLGRTGGVWCHPDSWLQPHAGWHLAAAAAMAVFAPVWAHHAPEARNGGGAS